MQDVPTHPQCTVDILRITRPQNVRFNARAYIDTAYLDGKPALDIVDGATRFSAARFQTKITTEAVCEAIMLCWSSLYTGLPNNIMVDEGSRFRKIFAELAPLDEVNLSKSGIESHNRLGMGNATTRLFVKLTGN